MQLEEQLKKLEAFGLALNNGVTIDDLLYSFERESYEKRSFDLILFILGSEVEREPWGRSFCEKTWNFDTECIYSTGDYVKIVKRLCLLTGNADYLSNVSDFIDLQSKKGWLKYSVNGKERNWTIEIDDDWVDQFTLAYILDDLERDQKQFYYVDNGQAMILFYLNEGIAAELNQLTKGKLRKYLAG